MNGGPSGPPFQYLTIMLIRIVDNHKIFLEQVDTSIDNMLFDHFSARHPRIRFIDMDQQGWDGYYRKYNSKEQSLALPFLSELIELCNAKDIPYQVVDDRLAPPIIPNPDNVDPSMLSGIQLESHQIEAIKAACRQEIGIISAPTGAGKTEIMAGIAQMCRCPTVIIADQRIIIEQIKARLELRDVIDEVGMFYGGSTPDGQSIVVGSIQSLSTPPISLDRVNPTIYDKRKKRSKQFQELVKQADLLMVDECDKAVSKQYSNLFRFFFNGRRKYGFSGTPFDKAKPVQSLMLRENLGSIICQTDRRSLEKIGRIIPVKFYMFAYGEDGDAQDKTIFDVAEREIVIDNPDFHKKVLRIVQSFGDDGTLILLDTSNIEDLGTRLEATIPGSVFIYGKTPKTARKQAIKAFEKRQLKCLIGGKIIKRGLDLAGGVENLIIIGGGKLWSEFDQKLGRAVRNNKRGWARVFSFLFLNNYYLYKHGREQLKALDSLGYQSRVIFKNATIDGSKYIQSRFRRPK
jgi:superfamily II DNA or RNA helicase